MQLNSPNVTKTPEAGQNLEGKKQRTIVYSHNIIVQSFKVQERLELTFIFIG